VWGGGGGGGVVGGGVELSSCLGPVRLSFSLIGLAPEKLARSWSLFLSLSLGQKLRLRHLGPKRLPRTVANQLGGYLFEIQSFFFFQD